MTTTLTTKEIEELKEFSTEARKDILKMIHNSASGHPGGSLSAIDILTVLYKKCMTHYSDWSANPNWASRDRFVLSKGHASPALYAVLAECGYIPKEDLMTFRKINSHLQGHPAYGHVPGVEVSTGSLGQGLSIACGIALGLKLDKSDSKVYVLMGDGETQEGSVWEGAMNAAHHKLDNLIVFVDRNTLQIDGCTENIKSLNPYPEKWIAFGWEVFEVDGHNHQEIFEATVKAQKSTKPSLIIASTVKGKGISFMENNAGWHGKAPSDDELNNALCELGE